MPYLCPLLLILAATAASAATNESTLRLEAEWNGQRLPIAAVEKGQVLLQDGSQTIAAPKSVGWHLIGDIRANANYLRWSPAYSIKRNAVTMRGEPDTWQGTVMVEDRPDPSIERDAITDKTARWVFDRMPTVPNSFLDDWPGDASPHSVLVTVWLVGGSPEQVSVSTDPAASGRNGFRVTTTFALNAEQREGQPVVLLWSDGHFIPPEPLFEHRPTQEAMVAALLDDEENLAAALRRARLREFSRDGATLAHYAAEAGSFGPLKFLLQQRESLASTALRHNKRLPSDWAASKGRTNTVALLLGIEASTKGQESPSTSTLDVAAAYGHFAVVGQLLAAGAPIEPPEDSREALPLLTAISGGFPDIADLIVAAAGSDYPSDRAIRDMIAPRFGTSQTTDEDLANILIEQAGLGHTAMVAWLIDRAGAQPNLVVRNRTALIEAARNGHNALVQMLVDRDVDIDQADPAGNTALMLAAAEDRPETVALLLRAGANHQLPNELGSTALHYAAYRDATAIISLLLDAGADMNFCDVRDMTALDTALLSESAAAVDQLVARGACIALGSKYSAALLEAAVRLDASPTIARAIDDGWPPNSNFAGIWPAIRVAQLLGAIECERVLRAAGAQTSDDRPMPVVEVAELDAPLDLLRDAEPRDPREPAEVFPAAEVQVQCLIDRSGRALFPKVLSTPDSRLGPAATTALQQQRFTPPLRAGAPVATVVTRTIPFPSSAARVFEANDIDQPPSKIRFVNPVRPERAPRNSTGRVHVAYTVRTDGTVTDIEIIESAGTIFSEAVLVALAQWTFKPGVHRQTPVQVRMEQTFVIR